MFELRRRAFLAAGSAALALSTISARATEYQEADTLKQLVGRGALPPLKERLPENPLVIKPHRVVT